MKSVESSVIPEIKDLLPHAAPMIYIAQILAHNEENVRSLVLAGKNHEPHMEGKIPAWIGLEYMAQTIGIYAGIKRFQSNEPIKIGFFIGTRELKVREPFFAIGQALVISVRPYWLQGEISVFDCVLSDQLSDRELMAGKLNVYQPPENAEIIQGAIT